MSLRRQQSGRQNTNGEAGMSPTNRRQFLIQAAAALPLSAGLRTALGASDSGAQTDAVHSYGEELPDMLLSYIEKKTNLLAAQWDQVRSRIRTSRDLQDRNRFVREKITAMLGGFPERSPLSPVIARVSERDGYRVENVMFQSRPNFWVTANLYVPARGAGPFPGIISPCGHYSSARIYAAYQFLYLDLVRNGFVVLAYDPIGQGERRYYWNPHTDKSEIGGPVTWEHDMPGHLLLLLGASLTQYRIWDGMRAIDYLMIRPEVDPKRIGCTGHSGGGTLTLFISALDERVQCAAIHEGGTRHRWPLQIRPETPIGTGDVEQHFFPAAIYGVDLCDVHVAIAPRPLLATIENYSPEFSETAQHIEGRYRLLDAPDRFATAEATDPHAMTVKLRLATADWFCRWFHNRGGPEREPEYLPELPETLHCTPNGSLRYSQVGETIFSLILKTQASLPPPRKLPSTHADFESFRAALGAEIAQLLKVRRNTHPLGVRHIVTTPRKGYHIEKTEFISEPGIYIPTWIFVPAQEKRDSHAVVYVHEAGKEAEGMEFGVIEQLARKGLLVVAVDVRGIGETKPPHPDEEGPGAFQNLDDAETAMSYWAWEMNESLFGMRVQDVIRCVDYALSRAGLDRAGVRLIGKGMGALWSLYAAVLDTRVLSVVLDGGLLSYGCLAKSDRYLHGANIVIPDVLRHFDLPQVAAAVANRPLALVSPVDEMKQSVELHVARQAFEWTRAAYAAVGAESQFVILGRNEEVDSAGQYLSLLGRFSGPTSQRP
jgi:cephalosporin-C deacetylase-like acetyl esterase